MFQIFKVQNDYAFVIDREYEVGKLIDLIKSLDVNIKSVSIFDVFEGGNLPNGKSVAVNVLIQSNEKTLSDKDLNRISQKIITEVQEKQVEQ